jgi:3,4-dihydroxy 2-butanone 4-phosphate synthase
MSSLIQPEIFFSALSPAEQRIQQALEDIRQGKPVLVMDDFDRKTKPTSLWLLKPSPSKQWHA